MSTDLYAFKSILYYFMNRNYGQKILNFYFTISTIKTKLINKILNQVLSYIYKLK